MCLTADLSPFVAHLMIRLLLAPAPARRYNQTENNKVITMKTIDRTSIVKVIQKEMPYLRQHFGVEQVALFGSFTRDEASEESDIDLVVKLNRPLGFAFFELADYLEAKLGRRVDLITASTLELGLSDPRRAHLTRNILESLIHV